jgi:hypothetical protein
MDRNQPREQRKQRGQHLRSVSYQRQAGRGSLRRRGRDGQSSGRRRRRKRLLSPRQRMNLQHWIDQHPSVCVAIFPIYFLLLWLLVGATISIVGGWFFLAKVYRRRVPFNGAKWGGQSGRMRGLANYNNVLTMGASQRVCIWQVCFSFGSCTLHTLFRGARSRCGGTRPGCSSARPSRWDMNWQFLCEFGRNWRRSCERRLASVGPSRRRKQQDRIVRTVCYAH